MMTSSEIRQAFLDFFKSKQHQIVPSAPIVVKNDPTLLFTNAGMNQFKDYFLGNRTPENPRIADTQKCLRVSGKHNDLEEVGVDTYHHTMFEMLGNWSFGDPARLESQSGGYFKVEAIAWSWELLTEVYKLDKDRLYVTIFEGDTKEGLPKDEEAFKEWKKVIAEDKILLGNKKDNFWEMGDTGPCGPCTEIHVDCRSDEERKKVDGSTLVNNDHPQVIEIWNNVFIQFNRLKDGSLQPLPAKHVDTGMGFERLVRVIQGKQSNYDTDVFTGTISAIEKITNKKYDFSDTKEAVAFRVLADHIRAICFTIADGQLPSNTGAGYVIRRILRRAVRYYYSYLDYKQTLLHQLIPTLAHQFENVFPELKAQQDFVCKVVKEEEESFLKTIDNGIEMFKEYISSRNKIGLDASYEYNTLFGDVMYFVNDDIKLGIDRGKTMHKIIPYEIRGKVAFTLFDRFGFPIDLTQLMAREINWTVDMNGFEEELQKQKNRSRAATVIDTEDWVILEEKTTYLSGKYWQIKDLETKSRISRYRRIKSKNIENYQIILDKSPFYDESGGQVGDTGVFEFEDDVIEVLDTKKENGLITHFTNRLPKDITKQFLAKVNKERRFLISSNHSATHLLHAALRSVLGTHVAQKGSLVNDEHLRFDFSHFAKVTDEEVARIETIVNEKIRANIPVVIKEMEKDEAIKLGAMALFGEKYGDKVRVVIMDEKYSIELCGGTHVGYTGELGFFKIISESAIAAGVRRIEAVSGKACEHYLNEQLQQLSEVKSAFNNPKELIKQIENSIAENKELKKKIESLETKQIAQIKTELEQQVENINGISFIGKVVELSNADGLKKLASELIASIPPLEGGEVVVVLTANINGKASVAIALSETIINKGFEAPKIIKEHITPIIKGGGGGQKNLATAGGQDASNLDKVIETVRNLF